MFGEDDIFGRGCLWLLLAVIAAATILGVTAMIIDHSVARRLVQDVFG